MATLRFTPQARANLKEIGRYIAGQSGDRSVAVGFVRRIEERCRFYAGSPLLGEVYEEISADIRRFHVGSYEVLFGQSRAVWRSS